MKHLQSINTRLKTDFSYQPMPFYDDRNHYVMNKNKTALTKHKLDLNLYCIKRPRQTCFIKVNSPNMLAWGIEQGDMLVVEKSEQINVGDLIIIENKGQFQMYEFFAHSHGEFVFLPLESKLPNIKTTDLQSLNILGTVTNIVHQLKPQRRTLQ